MVDAWPVLTAVSFQPNSDGSEGKCHSTKFKAMSPQELLCSLIHVMEVIFDTENIKSNLLLNVCMDLPHS